MNDPEPDVFVGNYPLWTCTNPTSPSVPLRLGLLDGHKPFVGIFTDEDLINRFLSGLGPTIMPEKLRLGSAADLLLTLAQALRTGATHVIFDPAAKGGCARFTGHIGQIVEQIGRELQPGRRTPSSSARA